MLKYSIIVEIVGIGCSAIHETGGRETLENPGSVDRNAGAEGAKPVWKTRADRISQAKGQSKEMLFFVTTGVKRSFGSDFFDDEAQKV